MGHGALQTKATDEKTVSRVANPTSLCSRRKLLVYGRPNRGIFSAPSPSESLTPGSSLCRGMKINRYVVCINGRDDF